MVGMLQFFFRHKTKKQKRTYEKKIMAEFCCILCYIVAATTQHVPTTNIGCYYDNNILIIVWQQHW